LSGSLEASEQGGAVQLRSQQVSIDLPDVFPESSIALDTLNAQAKWKISKGQARRRVGARRVCRTRRSRYRHRAPTASTVKGPGSIDLTATLSRADARAVWRYLPAAINVDARHWVRDALKAGQPARPS
jgi:uncharacterized protein YhdP